MVRSFVQQVIICIVVFHGTACMAGGITGAEMYDAKQWLSPPAETTAISAEGTELAKTLWHEVRLTRLFAAYYNLKDESALPLDEDAAAYYVGHAWQGPAGKKPFLVRGVYANDTGAFELFLKDGILLVKHSSLGSAGVPHICPLVVYLDEAPTKVLDEINVVE